MATLKKISATGDVYTVHRVLRSVILSPAAAAATLDVRLDGSGGTVVATLQAAANGNAVIWQASNEGVLASGLHATLAGAGASASFEVS
jgi:hypothetical protein